MTLEIDLQDRVSGLTLTLYFTVYPEWDVIVRKTRMMNPLSSGFPVGVDHLMSTTCNFESGNHHVTHLGGDAYNQGLGGIMKIIRFLG